MKAILVAILLVGCGSNGTDPMMGGDDEPPTPDAPPIPEGYTRLIGRTWSLPGGQPDTYRCVRFTVPEEMFITSIQAQAPFGTHHTVLSFAAGGNGTTGADGEQNCSVGTIGRVMMYASGVGTSPLDFPTDVGLRIPAGTQIHLNLHLFNATDNDISGDSAILVKAQTTPPPMLAEMVFAGGFLFQIPANNPSFTYSAGCDIPASSPGFTTFAVWPHQHQLGTHQKITVTRAGTDHVLHDGAYSFNEQNYYLPIPMFDVQANDRIRVACTWDNSGNNSMVFFGESSTEEMCFGGFYRFPALNEGIAECTDTGGAGF
jgi:hypothetical protein